MKSTNYREYILCIIFFIAGVGVQLVIGITTDKKDNSFREELKYHQGFGSALDTIKKITDKAVDSTERNAVILNLQDADTIYSYTLKRKDGKKFKK